MYDSFTTQYQLGKCYLEGIGVPKDKTEAVNWLRKAAEQGHRLAGELLQEMGD